MSRMLAISVLLNFGRRSERAGQIDGLWKMYMGSEQD